MFGLSKTLFGDEPRTYRQDTGATWGSVQSKRSVGLAFGLIAGTKVATANGWRPVEAITEGDLVLTFDRGLQPVRSITRGQNWEADSICPASLWPLHVPAGALGNQTPMTLLSEQSVMIESDSGDILFGDPFQLVSAADLNGVRGIERCMPRSEHQVIQLQFDNDEVVFANAGALIFCPSLGVVNMADLLEARPDAAQYTVLSSEAAAMLLECLEDEDLVGGAEFDASPAQFAQAS